MTDFLSRLAARALGVAPTVQPLIGSRWGESVSADGFTEESVERESGPPSASPPPSASDPAAAPVAARRSLPAAAGASGSPARRPADEVGSLNPAPDPPAPSAAVSEAPGAPPAQPRRADAAGVSPEAGGRVGAASVVEAGDAALRASDGLLLGHVARTSPEPPEGQPADGLDEVAEEVLAEGIPRARSGTAADSRASGAVPVDASSQSRPSLARSEGPVLRRYASSAAPPATSGSPASALPAPVPPSDSGHGASVETGAAVSKSDEGSNAGTGGPNPSARSLEDRPVGRASESASASGSAAASTGESRVEDSLLMAEAIHPMTSSNAPATSRAETDESPVEVGVEVETSAAARPPADSRAARLATAPAESETAPSFTLARVHPATAINSVESTPSPLDASGGDGLLMPISAGATPTLSPTSASVDVSPGERDHAPLSPPASADPTAVSPMPSAAIRASDGFPAEIVEEVERGPTTSEATGPRASPKPGTRPVGGTPSPDAAAATTTTSADSPAARVGLGTMRGAAESTTRTAASGAGSIAETGSAARHAGDRAAAAGPRGSVASAKSAAGSNESAESTASIAREVIRRAEDRGVDGLLMPRAGASVGGSIPANDAAGSNPTLVEVHEEVERGAVTGTRPTALGGTATATGPESTGSPADDSGPVSGRRSASTPTTGRRGHAADPRTESRPHTGDRGSASILPADELVPSGSESPGAPTAPQRTRGVEVGTRIEPASRERDEGRRRERSADGERPVVRVTIGRIEVRTMAPAPPPPPVYAPLAAGWKVPVLSLDQYLKRGAGP